MRRGIADYNGQGDVVGGIVVMRQGKTPCTSSTA
jgi:Cu/Ag efflux pump CusA